MTRSALPAWLRPAPDSLLAGAARRGRPAWSEFVHLLWSVWIFIVPMFTPRGYDARWWTLTLVSYPLFLLLYALTLLASPRRAPVYALGMAALCLATLPWYPAGMSYFVFGCVMLSARGARSFLRLLAELGALNAVRGPGRHITRYGMAEPSGL